MQRKTTFRITILAALLLVALGSPQTQAQSMGSSNMMFSPYTMYGIGDLISQGSASQMAMGGVGLATRNPFEINYLNPASLSVIPRNSALFSFGARGNNYYSKTAYASTAYNNFDVSDIGFAVPLARGVGLAFALQPVSAVGYNSKEIETTSESMEDVGPTVYQYNGEGGISQVSIGLGVTVVKGLSLGANLLYYFGNMDRYHTASIHPLLGQGTQYANIVSSDRQHISKVLYNLGLQYSIRVGKSSDITIGATYQPRSNISVDRKELIAAEKGRVVDTIKFSKYNSSLTVPTKIAAGVSYNTSKLSVSFDYSTQNWQDAFTTPQENNITLRSQDSYRIGAQYCPDRNSIKSPLKRWTYKAGVHYTTSYLMKDDVQLNEIGFSFGADIPLKRGSMSKISLGFDLGTRGTTRVGQVKENYFKIFAGITIFGDDMWFFKPKFY